jgi:archaellum component FlaC
MKTIEEILSILEPELQRQKDVITPKSQRLQQLREEVRLLEKEIGPLLIAYQSLAIEVHLAKQVVKDKEAV